MFLKWYFRLILLVQVLRTINVTVIGEIDQKPKCKDVLSRQKRYLIFIEGSSLQLVYDQIVPIVDYTNLFIFGLTVSMAWQLPDKPHYPPINTNASKRKYTKVKDKTSAVNATHGTTDRYVLDDSDEGVYNHSIYHNYVDNNSLRNYLLAKVTDKLRAGAYSMMTQKNVKRPNFEWSSEGSDWNDHFHQGFPIHYEPYTRYPALRMRREIGGRKLEEDLLTQHHIDHHISTRLDLYEKIRKYLDAKGEKGMSCIQRAICETTRIFADQRDNPSGFGVEILRAVFSLPDAHQRKTRNIFQEATFDSHREDCQLKYSECNQSIWNHDFFI